MNQFDLLKKADQLPRNAPAKSSGKAPKPKKEEDVPVNRFPASHAPADAREVEGTIINLELIAKSQNNDRVKLWREWTKAIADERPATRYARTDGTAASFREVLLLSRGLDIVLEGAFSSSPLPQQDAALSDLLTAALAIDGDVAAAQGLAALVSTLVRTRTSDDDPEVSDSARQMLTDILGGLKALALAAHRVAQSHGGPGGPRGRGSPAPPDPRELERLIAEKADAVFKQAPGVTFREQSRLASELVQLLSRKVDSVLGDGPDASANQGRELISRAAACESAASSAVHSFQASVKEALRVLAQSSEATIRARLEEAQAKALSSLAGRDGDLAREEAHVLGEISELQARIRALEGRLDSLRAERGVFVEKRKGASSEIEARVREMTQNASAVAARHRERAAAAADLEATLRRSIGPLAAAGGRDAVDSNAAAAADLAAVVAQLSDAVERGIASRQAQLDEVAKSLEWSAERLPKAREALQRAADISEAAAEKQVKQVADLERRVQEVERSADEVKAAVDALLAPARRLVASGRATLQQRAALNRLLSLGDGFGLAYRTLQDTAVRALDPRNIAAPQVAPASAGPSGPGGRPASAAARPGPASTVEDKVKELERQLKLKEARAAATGPDAAAPAAQAAAAPASSGPKGPRGPAAAAGGAKKEDRPASGARKEDRPAPKKEEKKGTVIVTAPAPAPAAAPAPASAAAPHAAPADVPAAAAPAAAASNGVKKETGPRKPAARPAGKPDGPAAAAAEAPRPVTAPAPAAVASSGPARNPWGAAPSAAAHGAGVSSEFPALGESHQGSSRAGPSKPQGVRK